MLTRLDQARSMTGWLPAIPVVFVIVHGLLSTAASFLLALGALSWDCPGYLTTGSRLLPETSLYAGAFGVAAWAVLPFWGGARSGALRWVPVSLLLVLATVPVGTALAYGAAGFWKPADSSSGLECTLVGWTRYDGFLDMIQGEAGIALFFAAPGSTLVSLVGVAGARWDAHRARRSG